MRLPLTTLVALLAGAASHAQDDSLAVARAIVRFAAPPTDDFDANVREALAAARRTPAHPATAMLVAFAKWRAGELADPNAYLAALEAFRAADPHPIAGLEALDALEECRRRLGRDTSGLDPGTRHAQALLALGPFGDEGDYYQGVVFVPELRFPKPGERVRGRNGEVTPRVARRVPPRFRIDLAEPGSDRHGCFYGLHQVDAARAVAGYVEVDHDGSFELFVNGAPAGGINRLARSANTLVRLPAVFRAGRNHVLIKTTNSERCEVSLRYLDADGRPLPDLTEAADQETIVPPAPAGELPPLPPPFRGLFGPLLDALENAPPAEAGTLRAAVAWIARMLGEEELLLRELQAGEAAPPADARDALALARSLLECERLPADQRRARARALVEGPGKALQDDAGAVFLRVSFLEDEDRLEDAIRLLQQRVAARQAGPETFRRLHDLQRRLRFDGEARRTRQAWREARPQDEQPFVAEAQERHRAGNARSALELLRSYAERIPGSTAVNQLLLATALELGEAELTLATLARVHREETRPLRVLLQRADTLERLGRADEAIEAWRELANRARGGDDAALAGDGLRRLGREEEALTAYRRALELEPGRHPVRRLLARAADGGGDDFPATTSFRHDADAAIRKFVPGPRDTSAPSTLLLDQMVVEVFGDGSQVVTTHQVRRLNDQKGVEQHQEAEDAAKAGELLRLRTVTEDGKSWVPNRVAGTFSMPRLAPGCFVEELYHRFEPATRPGPIRTTEFWFRSADEPFVYSEFVVIVDRATGGSLRTRNFNGERETRTLADGRVAHVLRLTDQPRLPEERRRPPDGDILPMAAFGEDGGAFAELRGDHAGQLWRTRSSAYVAHQARTLIGGASGDTARAQAIHKFVHESIPSGGEGRGDPTFVLLQKKGARFFLEAALLAEAGVPVRLAISKAVSAAFDDEAAPMFGGDDRYQVPALFVQPRDGAAFWLFADSPRWLPLGMIPAQRTGAAAVLLDEGAQTLVRVTEGDAGAQRGVHVTGKLTLDADGTAKLEATATIQGDSGYVGADAMRNQEGDAQKVVARRLAGSIFRGWTQQSVQFANLDRPGQPIAVAVRLTKSRALKPAGGDFLLPLPFDSRLLENWGDRAERTLPFQVRDADATTWEVTVVTDPHWQVVAPPPQAQERRYLLDYSLATRRVPEGLALRRHARILPGEIEPAQFGAWLDLLRRVDQFEEGGIRVAKRDG